MLDLVLIAAVDDALVIGVDGRLPWPHCQEDMKYFCKYTRKSWLVMSRTTYLSIPNREFKYRRVIVTHTGDECRDLHDNATPLKVSHDECPIDKVCAFVKGQPQWSDRVVICGGSILYKFAVAHPLVHEMAISHIAGSFGKTGMVVAKFPVISDAFSMVGAEKLADGVTVLKYSRFQTVHSPDAEYMKVMKSSMAALYGSRQTRNAECLSTFGHRLEFDISHAWPLLTTKRIPWKSCIEELLWFLKGHTNSKLLEDKGVNIWRGNTSREFLDSRGLHHLSEGECGPNYSYQWRNFGGAWPSMDDGVDQIANVLDGLKNDPYSRRHVVSAWNPKDIDATALPPCHILFQFYVHDSPTGDKLLSCQLYQRSADIFLGLPWNIASYSLLAKIFAKRLGYLPHKLYVVLGDAHIYRDHVVFCTEQLNRHARASPYIDIADEVATLPIEHIELRHFNLVGYHPHGKLVAAMVA